MGAWFKQEAFIEHYNEKECIRSPAFKTKKRQHRTLYSMLTTFFEYRNRLFLILFQLIRFLLDFQLQ